MTFHKRLSKKVFCVCLCLVSISAFAQRTTGGQGMISIEGGYPHAACFSFGSYLPSSMWEAGAALQWRKAILDNGDSQPYLPSYAFGNWMYRLAGTRSRAFNIYAGAGVFLGWEFLSGVKTLPVSETGDDSASGTFLYGINAKVQAEIFLAKSFAVILSGNAPVNFSSKYNWIQPCGCFGFRINL